VALRLIDSLGLYHTIFTDPGRQMPTPYTTNWRVLYTCLDSLAADNTPGSIFARLVANDEEKYAAWVFATVIPWEQQLPDPRPKGKKSAPPLPSLVAREGFKAPNKVSDIITAAHGHRPKMVELKDIVCAAEARMFQRDYFGMAIVGWDSGVGHWRLQLLYAILADIELRAGKGTDVKDVLAEWQKLLDHLVRLDLMNVPQLKRLVDGNMLGRELGLKPGIWVKRAKEIALEWQLRNPEATDPAGALEEVTKRRGELPIQGG
jgi:tRNA nucleotidyltransferase (CCA-adding enzyme)